jgi:hypothetical protein
MTPPHAQDNQPKAFADEWAAARAPVPATRVVVVDVNLPFGSMVTLLVKWALASIPALLVLGLVALAVSMALAAVGLGF